MQADGRDVYDAISYYDTYPTNPLGSEHRKANEYRMCGYRCDAEEMSVGKDAKAPSLGRLAATYPGYGICFGRSTRKPLTLKL